MKTHKILLKALTSKKGNEWRVYEICMGRYTELRIVRKSDRLVLDWSYYGSYIDREQPIDYNVPKILEGINLKEWQREDISYGGKA